MIAAVIALAVALAGSIGVIVWLVYQNNGRVDDSISAITVLTNAQRERNDIMVEAERAKYEAKAATDALNAERRRTDALEEFISHDALSTDPADALAPDDVAGRLLRFSRRVGGTEAARDPVPPGPDDLLRPNEG